MTAVDIKQNVSRSRPIRVMHILPWLLAGGVERRRLHLARHLDGDCFEQRVICLNAKDAIIEDFDEESVKVTKLPSRGEWSPLDLAGIQRVAREIREWQPDIVHGAVFEGVSMAALAGRLAEAPLIIVEETGDDSVRSWRGNLVMAAMTRLADACVGVSKSVGDYLRSTLRIDSSRVFQIDNGVCEFERSSPKRSRQLRSEWGIPEEAFVIGSLGRILNSQKRFTDLVEAFSLIADDVPESYLLIVGSGDDLEMLKSLVADKGLDGRVVFTGYQHDVEDFYGMMDVFALLSVHESFGLVVAEAMFCKLPVLATRVGGMQYSVQDGKTGILVDSLAPRQAADAIRKLHSSPELREQMGRAGRERAERNYGAKRYAQDVREMYLELLERKGLR